MATSGEKSLHIEGWTFPFVIYYDEKQQRASFLNKQRSLNNNQRFSDVTSITGKYEMAVMHSLDKLKTQYFDKEMEYEAVKNERTPW